MTGTDDDRLVVDGPAIDHPAIDDAFLARMVDAAYHPYVVIGGDGTILYASASVLDLVGAPPEHYVGRSIVEVLDPAVRDRVALAFAEFTAPDRATTSWIGPPLTVTLRHVDGHLVSCRALAVPAGDPSFQGLVLQIRATETTSKLDTAIASMVRGDDLGTTVRRILDFATEQMPYSIGAAGLGFDGRQFRSVVADPRAPVIGDTALPIDASPSPWRAVLDGDDVALMDATDMAPSLRAAAEEGGLPACWAHSIARSSREQDVLVFWRRASGAPAPHLAEAVGRIRRLIILAIEADRTRRLLEHQASTDDLTGLANRAALFDRLDEVEAEPPSSPFGILYLDLDDFKSINDACGHSVGDRVLEIAARRIGRHVRTGDLVARIGGDEFAAVCLGTHRDELERMASRLVEAFAEPITVDGREVRLGLSVGVALLDPTGETVEPEQLLDRADAAMLRAKALGKHRVQFADEI
jgi:diguanylate cyclase (GGDEF)-like protein